MESICQQANLLRVYKAILDATIDISHWLRQHTRKFINRTSYSLAKKIGVFNAFGDEKTDADVYAEQACIDHFKRTEVIQAYMSKESANVNILLYDRLKFVEINPKGEYAVSFYAIDGGTIVDTNYSVASIFGIWKAPAAGVNGSTGRDMVGAALSIYGSRTTMLLYNPYSRHIEELTLIRRLHHPAKWIVTIPKLEFEAKSHNFSPEGVKSCYENPAYLKVFEHYCIQGYSIRYSSSMAVDCYQMFIKHGGVYSSLETLAFGAKLQLITECIPIAFLIE